ncbi:MAG TPA: acetylglucosamine-6-sulfatase [Prolixibacteraceae bacterium]|nr:acetylglucosamine-6-sulfatase [Prolixibacteraceae bacterium]
MKTQTAKKPNILYIMSDDHAANAISCYDSRLSTVFKTPNIDRIGHEGVRLDHYYSTNSICTPARATVMTGQYGHINGVRSLNDRWHPEKGPNLAQLLKDVGYTTAIFGKWHLHCEPMGFDEYKYLSGVGGQGTYQNPEFFEKRKGKITHEGYVTDLITDMSLNWLRNRNREKPFFLMCHHKAPHDFWEYPQRYEKLFEGTDIPVPDSLFENKAHRAESSREYGSSVTPRSKVRSLYEDFCQPDYITGPLTGTENMSFEEKGYAAYQKYLKDYLRTVAGIDDSVGILLKELEEQGILDNTLVIYTSDQGMFLGEHDYQDKRWSYEESLKAPFLVRYPEVIPSGRVEDRLMANIDLAPTLLDFAGVQVPDSMQGFSCRKMLEGQQDAPDREAVYFRYWMHLAHRHHNPAHYGIRTKRWKLILYYGLPLDVSGAGKEETPAGWELYDMVNDPCELKNLYEMQAYRQIAEKLKVQLAEMKQKLRDEDDQYYELKAKIHNSI